LGSVQWNRSRAALPFEFSLYLPTSGLSSFALFGVMMGGIFLFWGSLS
jgi:hypothetical protein